MAQFNNQAPDTRRLILKNSNANEIGIFKDIFSDFLIKTLIFSQVFDIEPILKALVTVVKLENIGKKNSKD